MLPLGITSQSKAELMQSGCRAAAALANSAGTHGLKLLNNRQGVVAFNIPPRMWGMDVSASKLACTWVNKPGAPHRNKHHTHLHVPIVLLLFRLCF